MRCVSGAGQQVHGGRVPAGLHAVHARLRGAQVHALARAPHRDTGHAPGAEVSTTTTPDPSFSTLLNL